MPDLGPHTLFIITGYAGVALGTLGLIAWTWASSRAVKARLQALEAKGVRRRSAGPLT
jgi:heme exporter protein D